MKRYKLKTANGELVDANLALPSEGTKVIGSEEVSECKNPPVPTTDNYWHSASSSRANLGCWMLQIKEGERWGKAEHES